MERWQSEFHLCLLGCVFCLCFLSPRNRSETTPGTLKGMEIVAKKSASRKIHRLLGRSTSFWETYFHFVLWHSGPWKQCRSSQPHKLIQVLTRLLPPKLEGMILRSGAKHGCPLSPHLFSIILEISLCLFSIILEVLDNARKQENEIQG